MLLKVTEITNIPALRISGELARMPHYINVLNSQAQYTDISLTANNRKTKNKEQ